MTTKTKTRSTKRAATKKTAKRTTKKAATKAVRKTAKKPAVRKAATKKPRKTAAAAKKKQQLVYADGTACFWVHNGPVLMSLVDLHQALEDMNDELYTYHASGEQNDFAEWVEGVLLDRACATSLRRARQRKTAATAVRRRLTIYTF